MLSNKQIILRKRPTHNITDETFEAQVEQIDTEKLADGQVVVKLMYLSLDPAMRGWLDDSKSYVEPVGIGEVMRGGNVGVVVKSKKEGFSEGDYVQGYFGWQQFYAGDGTGTFMQKVQKVDAIPLQYYLSCLGMPGLTAYFGLYEIGKPKAGETILISAAAGAVGSVVGQLAKLEGLRVVGIAGTDEKCEYIVNELGFDEAINYKNVKDAAEWSEVLDRTCPDGIDIYFENVGGIILDAALAKINFGARIPFCGAISQYNKPHDEIYAPKNYMALLKQRATMTGFIVMDFGAKFGEALAKLSEVFLSGNLKYRDHCVEGLETASHEGINLLFSGQKKGKLYCKIEHDE